MGGPTKSLIRLTRTIAAGLVLCLAVAGPVAAVADPDSTDINSVYVVRNVAEAGDVAVVLHYSIVYAALPTENADVLFDFNLYDTDGVTLLGSVDLYPYSDRGFGQGIALFYFDSDDAPAWSSALVLKIQGSPSAAWTGLPPVVSYTLQSNDYSAVTAKTANQDLLYSKLITYLESLQTAWSVELLTANDTRTVLSTVGESYCRGAITGIQTLCPKLFAVMESTPDYTKRTWTQTLFTDYKAQWDGTPVGTALLSLGKLTKTGDWQLITGALCFLLLIGAFVVSYKMFYETRPAIVAGMNGIFCGACLGFVSPLLVAIPTLAAALFIGYGLIFRNG